MQKIIILISTIFMGLLVNGCSTMETTAHYTLGGPKLYSGTRMDLDAMKESDEYIYDKYNAEAPSNPKLDLPFSFILDTAILPVVLPVALSDAILE
jgi:uncharacterized protein YceK